MVKIERDEIDKALAATVDVNGTWNIGKAARQLGCSRRTLQHRMREYGMAHGTAGRRFQRLPKRSKDTVMKAVSVVTVVGVGIASWALGRSRHRYSPKA